MLVVNLLLCELSQPQTAICKSAIALDINRLYYGESGIESGSLIKGNDGDDAIVGGPAADVIYGGAGDDTLSGGDDGLESSNTFVFEPGSGKDIIVDFNDGYDALVFEGFSESELSAIVESTTNNGDRKILFQDGSSVTLLNNFGVEIQHLTEMQVIFHLMHRFH